VQPSPSSESAAPVKPPPSTSVSVRPPSTTATPPRRRRDVDEDTQTAAGAAKPVFGEGGDCVITIGSRPWSEVWIDGKTTSKHTPVADLKVPCGRHRLGFKRADLQIDRTETITVRPGEKFKQVYTLTKDTDF
jgi:hypothetical protein